MLHDDDDVVTQLKLLCKFSPLRIGGARPRPPLPTPMIYHTPVIHVNYGLSWLRCGLMDKISYGNLPSKYYTFDVRLSLSVC